MEMLILQIGKCPECGSEFGPYVTEQQTNVTCSKCKKEMIVCESCKEKGCECGGKLENTWDVNPGTMF
jgi:hypothetical protein